MDELILRDLLDGVGTGRVSVDDALQRLKTLPYDITGDARLDRHRALRRGFPEVILGEGKTSEQVATLLAQLHRDHRIVLCTRANSEQVAAARKITPHCYYDPLARVLFCAPPTLQDRGRGTICVVSAGTADLRVAREALWTAALMGNRVELVQDVGIAGLQRLLGVLDQIRAAEVVIVIAGMEGALPSVLGGLCDRPIIAVPVSVGYGSGRGGWPALLAMLNSCVSGITVVNIDNGFGAGYAASLINRNQTHPHESSEFALESLPMFSNLIQGEGARMEQS